jgi:hypothetical protein
VLGRLEAVGQQRQVARLSTEVLGEHVANRGRPRRNEPVDALQERLELPSELGRFERVGHAAGR